MGSEESNEKDGIEIQLLSLASARLRLMIQSKRNWKDWLTKALAPKSYVEDGSYFKHDFVTVYFRHDRAVQIEASSAKFKTVQGLSTSSGAKGFQRRFSQYNSIQPPHFHDPDSGGCPASKHFVTYEDAKAAGIAWRYGGWGNLSPDPDPDRLEMVIVHRRGQPVIVDPDGGVRLVWKIPPHELMDHYPTK